MVPALLLALLACADAPDPCARMCARAEALYGACLESWGLGWEAAGYADADDFLGRCETWAWEMRLLEEDAVRRGELEEAGAVDAACQERADRFEQAAADPADLDCEAYTGEAWDQVPWAG